MAFSKDIELTKQQIRSKILIRLKTQKEEDRDRKSKAIKRKLFSSQGFKQAKRVMFYISFDGEVETREMIKAAHKLGKIVAAPVCLKNRMILRPAVFTDRLKLIKGPYGICEPATKGFVAVSSIDLVVVPGVAFDKRGNRLGRGKGYYDRFLKTLSRKTASVGLAFDFQILPSLPTTTTDVRVDKIIFA
jgi:5-formyltetrahydrofolate cyclo-ligase